MKLSTRLAGLLVAGAVAVASLTACAPSDDSTPETPGGSSEAWPRTFTNADGTTTEIPSKPERVLSTSVSITGTLLAIDAPVIASGSAGNGTFFAQWAPVAEQRQLQNIWPAGSPDIEAVIAAEPDLIIVSTSGADSVLDLVAELNEYAPTLVIDYAGQTWQELAAQLGEGLGIEEQVTQKIGEFDAFVAESKTQLELPAGTANIISYNGAGEDNPIAKNTGPHAQLLTALGFVIEEPPAEWHTQAGSRNDFVWAAFENLSLLNSETTFLLSSTDERAAEFKAEPTLANLPSVRADSVYGLGANSFRIDLYSSTEIVNEILQKFAR